MKKKLYISSSIQEKTFYDIYTKRFEQVYTNDAEILIADVTPIDVSTFKNLKYIVAPMTNTNHIKGVTENHNMISLQGETEFLKTIHSTAEHTLLLMLMLLRKQFKPATRQNRYDYTGHTLRDKTVGLIGLGRIGTQVKSLVECFGAKVIYHDPAVWSPDSKLEVLMQSDIISIHASVQTRHNYILRDSDFASMKKGVYLINTARPCFDEEILLKNHQHFGGIALDVVDHFNEFKELPNCIVTPHIGGNTYEDRTRTSEFCYHKLMQRIALDDQTT